MNPGPPASLGFTTQPTNTTAGVAINSPGNVVVTAKDQFGNTATSFISQLTMSLGANPASGVLSGTLTATPTAGVANFGNLRIKKAGTGYQLSASGGSLTTNPLSSAFTITTAPLIKLGFVVEPGTTADSAPITPNPQVAGQDSVNNTVTGFTGSVRMFLQSSGTNPGGGTLSGTTQVSATTGVATFTNLRINALGNRILAPRHVYGFGERHERLIQHHHGPGGQAGNHNRTLQQRSERRRLRSAAGYPGPRRPGQSREPRRYPDHGHYREWAGRGNSDAPHGNNQRERHGHV